MRHASVPTLLTALLLSTISTLALASGTNEKIRLVGDADLCMDVNGSKQADGTEVFLIKCHNQSNQKWAVTATADNKDVIVGIGGLCLDVKSAHPGKDGASQIWKCHFGANQKFQITADGHIKEVASGKCLQAVEAKQKAPIVVDDCGKTKFDTWKFES